MTDTVALMKCTLADSNFDLDCESKGKENDCESQTFQFF